MNDRTPHGPCIPAWGTPHGGYRTHWIPCSCGEGRKIAYVHRLIYEAHHGPIPEGLVVDHLCENKWCGNPDHLEAITASENTHRYFANRKAEREPQTHCAHGHPLSPDNVRSGQGIRVRCKTCRNARQRAIRARAARPQP